MIDPNILNILKSNTLDPSYSIVIENFYQPEFCNRDELQMLVHQVNPNLFDIITKKDIIINTLKELLTENNIPIPNQNDLTINNIVSKTLTIDSVLNYSQENNMFVSGLTGKISAESNQNIQSQALSGQIKNKRIMFTTKDYPNVLDNHQFIVKKNQVIININDNIETIGVKITHDSLITTYEHDNIAENVVIPFTPFVVNTITDNQVIVDMDDIKNSLNNSFITPLNNDIEAKTAAIETLEEQIEGGTLTPEEKENAETAIAELTADKTKLIGKKEVALTKIDSLTFTATKPYYFDIKYTCHDDITTNKIECINFELKSELTIDFMNLYRSTPGVIITIDQKKKLYSSYETTFSTNANGYYNGVTVTFNNLRRIREPVDVNIIIIGDAVV